MQVKSISYPKPEDLDMNGQKLAVFTGTVPIETQFVVALDARKGEQTVTGKLRYQACNSNMCFRPATIDVHFTAVIE